MPRVLLTAYGPYDDWPTNASWLVLQEVTRDSPANVELLTRLYPVDFAEVKSRLADDLSEGVDVAIHLGQSPGLGRIELEAIGLNLACERDERPEEAKRLVEEGPAAYLSELPLASWARLLRADGIPAEVSHHAGAYLCNAAHYLSHHIAAERGLPTKATFLHLPLDPSQVLQGGNNLASQSTEATARGVRLILDDIAQSA